MLSVWYGGGTYGADATHNTHARTVHNVGNLCINSSSNKLLASWTETIYGQLETLDQTENMSDVRCGVFKISRGGQHHLSPLPSFAPVSRPPLVGHATKIIQKVFNFRCTYVTFLAFAMSHCKNSLLETFQPENAPYFKI